MEHEKRTNCPDNNRSKRIIHEHFTKDLNRLHTNDINVSEIQKIVLLGTAYIIRRFFTQVNFM